MSEWYELDEQDRIKEVFSKYTIESFWKWWSNNEQKVMEVRIKDFELIKELSYKYRIPKSASGVYVSNASELKIAIQETRNKATTWFGIQPRKANYHPKFGYKGFGGTVYHVDEISYFFIDIDRAKKDGPASKDDLKNCDILANKIIDRMGEQGWNKNYMKICSGNGVQLAFKLDYPIKMPNVEYDNKSKMYKINLDWERLKGAIKNGIGKQILKFSNRYKEELQIDLDKSVFDISRVGALPVTKNYKYNGFTWRGIVKIVDDGQNTGLSDYMLSCIESEEVFKTKNLFVAPKTLHVKNRLIPGKLRDNVLIKFMLDNNLPSGMRNNYLWFQVKCLLRDSNIDLQSEEFKDIHRELEHKYGSLPCNIPQKKFGFDEDIVNKYCIDNFFPPIYPLWPKRTKKYDMKLEYIDWDNKQYVKDFVALKQDTSILEDLAELKETLEEGDYDNVNKVLAFTNACINKYGEEKTKYYFYYIFKKYLSYS